MKKPAGERAQPGTTTKAFGPERVPT